MNTEHRHNPWQPPQKKYRPRERPVMPTVVTKELEPTRAARKRATVEAMEKDNEAVTLGGEIWQKH